ncbi:MAG: MBL fold metallo-hydrolase [Pseudomonas sp.]|uniref:MBL fold metallo-hydrolase n=1 Tax=Pseudomonas abieticivorans TaxID=2931382 RepID=UPI0020BE2E05|nr:MBL fold metallo-hydrolase [Pseudomonas sp. PIA16]MDE1167724.1 MBL fold metallo-hydrolase [Pseudomonas sp.]
MAKFTQFEVGYCTHIACLAQRGAGLRVCKFPARAYLLEVGSRCWLWDTGYSTHFQEQTKSGLFRVYRHVTPVYFDPRESLVEQLRAAGLASNDIEGVILSHFHADHIAGLRDFNQSNFICSGQGWQQTRALRGFAALKQAFIPGLIPESFEARLQFIERFARVGLPEQLAPFDHGFELPGSGGQIFLVPLPGHAVGHIGAFILTEAGWTLLASDAGWSTHSYQTLRGPSVLAHWLMDDPRAYHDTLRRLNQLWAAGLVDIRLCHEGDL